MYHAGAASVTVIFTHSRSCFFKCGMKRRLRMVSPISPVHAPCNAARSTSQLHVCTAGRIAAHNILMDKPQQYLHRRLGMTFSLVMLYIQYHAGTQNCTSRTSGDDSVTSKPGSFSGPEPPSGAPWPDKLLGSDRNLDRYLQFRQQPTRVVYSTVTSTVGKMKMNLQWLS